MVFIAYSSVDICKVDKGWNPPTLVIPFTGAINGVTKNGA